MYYCYKTNVTLSLDGSHLARPHYILYNITHVYIYIYLILVLVYKL